MCKALFLSGSASQYLTFQQKPDKSHNCDNANSNTVLVEHFFNLIFSEFLNHPPVCVCVQMCPEHPTYCYPNGCLKKVPNKKSDHRLFQVTPHVHNMKGKGQMTFLVDPQTDFLENLMDSKSVNENVEKVNDQQNKVGKSLFNYFDHVVMYFFVATYICLYLIPVKIIKFSSF